MNNLKLIAIGAILIIITFLSIVGLHYYNRITMPKSRDISYRETYVNTTHWNSPYGKEKETLLDYIKN